MLGSKIPHSEMIWKSPGMASDKAKGWGSSVTSYAWQESRRRECILLEGGDVWIFTRWVTLKPRRRPLRAKHRGQKNGGGTRLGQIIRFI